MFRWVEPWANPIRKLFGSADGLPTSCVRPRRIVSTSLQSHQLNLLVIASFTDRNSSKIKDNSRNADEFWPIGIVSCLFYLCLNRWRLKWADRSYYGVSCRIPRESWEKGWFIRKVHYPLFPTVLSRLSVIDDCVVFEETLGDLHGKKYVSSASPPGDPPGGPVLVNSFYRRLLLVFSKRLSWKNFRKV